MRRFRRHHHARFRTTRQQQQNSFWLLLVGNIRRCRTQDHHSILVDIAAMVLMCLATVPTATKSFATAASTTNEICCFLSNVSSIKNQRRFFRTTPTTFLSNNNNNNKQRCSLFEKTSQRIRPPPFQNVLDYDNLPSIISTTTTRIFAQSSSTSSTSSNIEASSSSSMTADIDIDIDSTTTTTTISQPSSWIHENIESENIGPSTIISSSATEEEEGKDDSNKKVTEAQLLQGKTTTTTSFPFSLIVGNDLTKKALLLAAANPKGLGSGVLLIGGHGSCKSVLCRSMQQLMSMTSLTTKEEDQKDGCDSNNVAVSTKTVVVPPFVTVPLHCQEDALLGSVDLEKSMKEGVAVYEPGLLARAHNGILHIDDIHLLDDSLIHILLTAVSDGYVSIEREGISVKYPCRPIVLASYNPVEGGGMDEYGDEGGGGGELLRQHWMDRIAMTVPMTDFSSSSTTEQMTIEDRVEVVQNVENFVDKTLSSQQIQNLVEEERNLQNTIHTARTILPNVMFTKEQLLYLCQEASRADCEGQRGEIYASEIAKTSAALDGRVQVNSEDLKLAVLLAIAPRSRAFTTTTTSSDYDDEQQPPQRQQQQQPSSTMDQPEQESPPLDNDDSENQPEDLTSENQEMDYDELDQENNDQEPKEEEEELSIPDHFMFGVDAVPLDPQLLNFQQWTRKGNKGGKRSKIFNLKRGRFVKAIIPKDVSGWKSGKIAVGATLRAAAPYQKIRRERSLLSGIGGSDKPVHIRDVDFRIQRMARKSGSLILFVVDSSGSMALNRMGAAKGAAMSLLNEAYKCRDQICLISFHDTQAEVVVPPTKSMALARNRLEAMPCGGKTPLAHALVTAIRTGMNAVKVKQDVGRVVVVLLADGRANVPLCVSEGEAFDAALMDPDFDTALSSTSRNNSGNNLQQQQPSRAFLKEEILALAKQLGSLKEFDLVCVDTEDKFVGAGIAKELTRAASGTYFHLTPSTTTAESVAEIALQGVRHASQGH